VEDGAEDAAARIAAAVSADEDDGMCYVLCWRQFTRCCFVAEELSFLFCGQAGVHGM